MARGIQPPPSSPGVNHHVRRPQSPDVPENQGSPRRTGLSLPLNTLAIPFASTPTREAVEEGGEALFQYFLEERLAHDGLSGQFSFPSHNTETISAGDVPRAAGSSVPVSTPDGYKNFVLAQHGRQLNELAEKFAKSKQNIEVRNQADSVRLSDITQESFFALLYELFRDGFSRERLIALFFFCVYLIIRAIREKTEHTFQDLVLWSLQYIKDNVCRWVYEQGGWGRVLNDVYNIAVKVGALFCLGMIIIATGIYIRKNTR